jgi:hypothetical protein
VLIRPHPGHAAGWASADFQRFGPVAIWPRAGEMPIADQAKQHYFDSLFHCSAVAGVNTSGMIEAAVVGRRSYTLLAREFRETQTGTVHFEYLTSYGFLTTAHSWEEHLAHLGQAIAGGGTFDERARTRTLTFVRPYGLDEPGTPRVVAAIEEAATLRRTPAPVRARGPAWLALARMALAPWYTKPRAD